jgi:hypothetical protein
VRRYRRILRVARAEMRAVHVDAQAARANSERLLDEVAAVGSRLEHSERVTEALASRFQESDDRRAADHDRVMHALRIARDDDAASWNRLWELRGGPDYERAFTDPDPLVSILISTYDNWRLLKERALPSVLAQTYEHWECVVVGDAAPPETAEVVAACGDPRIRFVNLPYRGPYPERRDDAWLISGTNPFNTALKLARGRWIGVVDDDDALVPEYIESLLGLARERHAELAYGQLRYKFPDRPDELVGVGPPPRFATWGLQCSLFHAGLGFIPMLSSDWLFATPNDWSWAERLLRIGVRFAMLEAPVVDYYPSRVWNDRPPTE